MSEKSDSFKFLSVMAERFGRRYLAGALRSCLIDLEGDNNCIERADTSRATLANRYIQKESRKRSIEMFALRNSGKTFKEIGKAYGVTIERARQIIEKHRRVLNPY